MRQSPPVFLPFNVVVGDGQTPNFVRNVNVEHITFFDPSPAGSLVTLTNGFFQAAETPDQIRMMLSGIA